MFSRVIVSNEHFGLVKGRVWLLHTVSDCLSISQVMFSPGSKSAMFSSLNTSCFLHVFKMCMCRKEMHPLTSLNDLYDLFPAYVCQWKLFIFFFYKKSKKKKKQELKLHVITELPNWNDPVSDKCCFCHCFAEMPHGLIWVWVEARSKREVVLDQPSL